MAKQNPKTTEKNKTKEPNEALPNKFYTSAKTREKRTTYSKKLDKKLKKVIKRRISPVESNSR